MILLPLKSVSKNQQLMKTYTLFILIISLIAPFNVSIAQPNDLICNAISFSTGTVYAGNTTSATATDPSDAAVSTAGFVCSTPNNTLWYSYSSFGNDTFKIITTSPVTGLNIWLGVFKATNCNGTLSYVNCIRGAIPGASDTDEVVLTSGTYYFMVDGFSGSVGNFSISLNQRPFNDYCSGAATLSNNVGLSRSFGTITPATTQTFAPFSCTGNTSPKAYDVWYKFTAVQSAAYVYVQGYGQFDAVVGIYSGCGGALLNCADVTSANGVEKFLATGLSPANTYYLRVYHRGNYPPYNSYFYVGVQQYLGPAPANDECINATSIIPSSFPACTPLATTVANSTSTGLYAPCGATAYTGNDVWYKFVANAQNVDIEVSPAGLLNPIAALFGSCNSSAIVASGCNVSSGTVILEARGLTVGQIYYVSVFSQNTFSAPANPAFTICAKGYTALPPNAEITFKLDINPAIVAGIYQGGVPDITGNFNNYTPSVSDNMDSISAGIFKKTYNSFQQGDTVQYKFRINHNWSTWEVSSRQYIVNDGDTVSNVWGDTSITIIDATYKLPMTFKVNMSNETVSPSGVFIVGNFNNYDSDSTAMIPIGNNVYQATVDLDTSSFIRYRFVNGLSISGAENVPSACGLLSTGSGFYERYLSIPEAATTLPTVCFDTCSNCIGYSNVTFRVDLSFKNVSPNGVHLAGNFNNWDYNSLAMTETSPKMYEATVSLDTSSSIRYKFVNGNTASDAEVVPSACGIIAGSGGYKRFLDVSEANATLAVVCYEACVNCGPTEVKAEGSPTEVNLYYDRLGENVIIESKKVLTEVKLIAADGTVLKSALNNSTNNGSSIKIQCSNLPNGVYLIQMRSADSFNSKKFLVVH